MANVSFSTVRFFLERMESHNCVERCTRLRTEDDEYIFEIERKGGLARVNVHLSDAYDYGQWEYLSHPREIGRGDFILIAGFSSRFDESLVELARKDGIGIGVLAKFMGALNLPEVWKYKSPEEKTRGH
jgi:hypothetical protein